MKTNPKIIIIGAGPAGLGAGWRLTELGYEQFALYDKNPYVGGLAASFTDDAGFTWDIGGHVLHSHYPYFDRMFEAVMEGEYLTHKRESFVWIADRFVPYPFQNNIHLLPEQLMRECVNGLRDRSKQAPKNFSEWITTTYGSGIAKHFMYPYNRKVWAYPLDKMSYQWVADRVAPAIVQRGVSWGPNAVFHYPKQGGTGDIWRRVARRFSEKIHLRKEMISLDTTKKRVRFADGSQDAYDVLFSTVPLDRLVPSVRTKLHRCAVTIVGVGMQGDPPDELRSKSWMYFPGNESYFRATVLSNYSQYNAPNGTWSLMFEISSSSHRPLPIPDSRNQRNSDSGNLSVADMVIASAIQIKLIPKGTKIIDVWTMTSEYGYPTPTVDRDSVVDPLLKTLEKDGIYSRGRFGMWKYEVSNQDHTFMQGVEWADAIKI